MIACPNCGWSNEEGSRFCENCGADLRSLAQPSPPQPVAAPPSSQPSPPPAAPPPSVPPAPPQRPVGPSEIPPTSPEWRMSPLPPEEVPPKRRRTWLWVLLGLVVALILCCVGFATWLEFTESGKNFQTAVVREATEQAGQQSGQ
ncbi:MAG: hypothetical protein KatS3mg059_1198 [Thermomicrobiales bacterium]|nr:MAG: hypothetical protein KatS3mg059_1198 [Thermomicrobiales bacterium]